MDRLHEHGGLAYAQVHLCADGLPIAETGSLLSNTLPSPLIRYFRKASTRSNRRRARTEMALGLAGTGSRPSLVCSEIFVFRARARCDRHGYHPRQLPSVRIRRVDVHA
jgi:hypothetical protein